MRDFGVRLLIGLAFVAVGVMAVGYAFIFSGIATPPDAALGRIEAPGPGDAVAAFLDDGTPVFAISLDGSFHVLDARAPAGAASVPSLVAWCDAVGAFESGPIEDGGPAATMRFEPDGTAVGLAEAPGLSRYPFSNDGGWLVIQGRPTATGGRVGAPPACPPAAGRVLHRPEPDEVFDPSLAAGNEPPGMVWMEGTLRSIGGRALLCDSAGPTNGDCAGGAVARGIDPGAVPDEGVSGLFVGWVHDGAVAGLAYAAVLTQMEAP